MAVGRNSEGNALLLFLKPELSGKDVDRPFPLLARHALGVVRGGADLRVVEPPKNAKNSPRKPPFRRHAWPV